MLYLPKFLYPLWNSPIYITNQFFKKLNSELISFIWANKAPRIAWLTLTAPKEKGGLALPHLQNYYFAAQLSYIHNWFNPDRSNSLTALHAAIMGSLEAIRNLPYRRQADLPPLPEVLTTPRKAWVKLQTKVRTPLSQLSGKAPLWRNSNLPHMRRLVDFQYWPQLGIRHLDDLLVENCFASLEQLKVKLNGPNIQFFRYLQLRHAFHSQFGSYQLSPTLLSWEARLWALDPTKLVSQLYSIIQASHPAPFNKAKRKWLATVPSLDEDQWDETTDNVYDFLISLRDRMIQFKMIHQIYVTPLKLKAMGKLERSKCVKCNMAEAGFLHLIWDCPKVLTYWTEVTHYIEEHLSLPGIRSPEVCLLGIIDELIPLQKSRTLLRSLVFYAKKVVIMKWMSPIPPTIQQWIELINGTLPLIRLTYNARGVPEKFEKIWEPWLDANPSISLPDD
uniref:Reverse transcriptase zinc-binding domain-containing protein n=1 Tax=Xenopus tropicalis TaxID=8364 RepID=A0A803JZ26_XENTR